MSQVASVKVDWDHSKFQKNTLKKGMDGLEEWAKTKWQPHAKKDSPVLSGDMRGSLTTERDDGKKCVYVGGGGPSADYILKQEMNRSLNHPVGKAGFIRDSVDAEIGAAPGVIQKHIDK